MKVIEMIINEEDELYKYIDTIDEGDYVEAYFGRCHLEGTVISKDGTFFRLDSDNDLMGLVELELSSVVDDLIECAPELKNWILVALRPRTNQMDQAIELDGLYLSYDDIFYQVHSYTLPLKLTIFIKDYDGKDQRYVHGYFLLFDTLIGERNVALYTETLGVHPYNTEDARPFVTLRDLFDELEKKELPQ